MTGRAMEAGREALLTVAGLKKNFGGVKALEKLDLTIASGELVGLIGPNGSGKTTAFNLLTGVFKPSGGHIVFRGQEVAGNRPEQNARLGMARTFQNIRLFRDLPVIDNVAVGLHMRHGAGFWPTVLRFPAATRSESKIRERALEVLEILDLRDRAGDLVANLPYGDQRKVEFARALATEPVLLLLDEPSAGMNPHETAELGATISRLHRELGLTIILVEHDMKMIMTHCQRIHVMHQGRILAEGSPAEIQRDPRVIEAYLGRRREGAHAVA
ncbi:MAG: ABC transporter ATP-binding protein [Hypericibacter sp.]